MPKLLPIAQLGNPILRKQAKIVDDISDRKIQELIDDMIHTTQEANGVGLAAPQVSESLQIFIVASHPNPRYPYAPKMKPTAIINPKIISKSKKIIKDWEGCLSIPGIRGLVPRHESITTEYVTRDGKKEKKEFTDFIARIFQHEYDHLEGIEFLDRLKSTKDIITEQEWQKITK
jgi:peptide deformylase|tara:strand:- start:285 stop:809 length:525 start_codon:yes stop_codon:yes gene_type:complete